MNQIVFLFKKRHIKNFVSYILLNNYIPNLTSFFFGDYGICTIVIIRYIWLSYCIKLLLLSNHYQ